MKNQLIGNNRFFIFCKQYDGEHEMKYLNKPFLPEQNISTALVDYRIGAEAENELRLAGVDVIKTVPCTQFYEAIMGHPDMLMHPLSGNKLVIAPNVFDKLQPVLTKKGFALTKGETWLNRNYPENIAYNVLRIGSKAFHHTKYTDKALLRELEREQVDLIHVKQGYTKCAVCIVNEKAVITADRRLAETMEKQGMECLLIPTGGIHLEGLDYGFIGGSAGLLSKNTLAFTGKLDNIKEYYKIVDFLSRLGIEVKILSTKQIFDIGTIIPLTY
jgi:hypothetical protein